MVFQRNTKEEVITYSLVCIQYNHQETRVVKCLLANIREQIVSVALWERAIVSRKPIIHNFWPTHQEPATTPTHYSHLPRTENRELYPYPHHTNIIHLGQVSHPFIQSFIHDLFLLIHWKVNIA